MAYIGAGRFLVALLLAVLAWMEFGVEMAEGVQMVEYSPLDQRATHLASRGDPAAARASGTQFDLLATRSHFVAPTPTPIPSPTPAPTLAPVTNRDLFLMYRGTFKITAYSDSPRNGTDGRGITRSGELTRWGVVAVDPEIIPLYTRLMIEGMGDTVFTALDTGGGIKGRWVDIWFPTDDEALVYGVQEQSVFQLLD